MKSLLVKGKWLPEEQYLLEIREEITHVNLSFLRSLGANNPKQSIVLVLWPVDGVLNTLIELNAHYVANKIYYNR